MRGVSAAVLGRYVAALEAGAPAPEALGAALAALVEPWDRVEQGGVLARCPLVPAPADLHLDTRLAPARAGVRVRAGQLHPAPDPAHRKRLGAWDTPRALAQELLRRCVAVAGPPAEVLDPACGAGALLLAAAEAGASTLRGEDLDPLVCAVARAALPGATLGVGTLWEPGAPATWVLCNPPFVRPERQDRALRGWLGQRWPWLRGRFDLAVPALAAAQERVAPGGLAGLVVPAPVLQQPYGTPLRRRWLAHDRVAALSAGRPFPGAGVRVRLLVLQPGQGPAPLPWAGAPHATELLGCPSAPLDEALRAGDLALAQRLSAAGPTLGSLCRVDTGLVAHGPGGGKARLLHAEPGPGRLPYADARDLVEGRRRWLEYRPEQMHRPKDPALFAPGKVLVQRVCGGGPLRAWVDAEGITVGHTLLVVQPGGALAPGRVHALLTHPLIAGWLRVMRGRGMDIYPHDIQRIPVPSAWLNDAEEDLAQAAGLSPLEAARLLALGAWGAVGVESR